MRTINVKNSTIQLFTNRDADIPDDNPHDNITVWVIRNDVLDTYLSADAIDLCEDIQAYKDECGADIELHIEDDGVSLFVHAVDQYKEVQTVGVVPPKVRDMLNAMSLNIAAIEIAVLQYQDYLNGLDDPDA